MLTVRDVMLTVRDVVRDVWTADYASRVRATIQ
jgi:hypothetical protein